MVHRKWKILLACLAAGAVPLSILFCVPAREWEKTGVEDEAAAAKAPEKKAPLAKGPPGKAPISRYLVVDQFGYRPEMRKVAVLVDPVEGWNAKDSYEPSPEIEVRQAQDDKVVFQGKPQVWKGGALDILSGDRGSWFDFSELRELGKYYLYDPKNHLRSGEFVIKGTAYDQVLAAALRAFYFNRANFAKVAPFACVGDKCWLQGADYVGPGQDKSARSVRKRDDPKTERDLHGGFWDAGDVNKYTTFMYSVMHQLLTAYVENPHAFTDNLNIPESGNGIPDLLDEVDVEIRFLERMQADDLKGGVLLKVGNVAFGDPKPEASDFPRYYYPESCSSAVITVASVFAQAALVYASVPKLEPRAEELKKRALAAFSHYQKNPKSENCDDGTIHAGDADVSLAEQELRAVSAAVYLYALTNEPEFFEFVEKNWQKSRPFTEDRWSIYDAPVGDALLYFATHPKNASTALAQAILNKKREQSKSDIYVFDPEKSLYRSYMRRDSYHWGSNQARANHGNTVWDLVQYGLVSGEDLERAIERTAGLLHWFHGVNAMGLVYLSNMYPYGAERSVNEIYHVWFRDGDPDYDSALTSRLGPAPGYVVGGPNPTYCQTEQDHVCRVSLFQKQPPEKAYVDFNTGWEPKADFDMSWSLTEPATYYQAAYVKLLSKFVGRPLPSADSQR